MLSGLTQSSPAASAAPSETGGQGAPGESDVVWKPTPPPRMHRILEVGSVLTVFGLLVWMGVRVARGVHSGGQVAAVGVALLAGYLVADLVSGIVHWMGDTLGSENAKWFGPAFTQPFREHHVDPRAISRHGFVETNGNTCIVALPPLGAAHAWMPDEAGVWFYLAAFAAALSMFSVAANQFHKWAHSVRVPRFVAWLQRSHLIIEPNHHNRHHEAPHRSHYCVLSGWMNPVADGLRLFRAAEHVIRRTRPGWLSAEVEQRR